MGTFTELDEGLASSVSSAVTNTCTASGSMQVVAFRITRTDTVTPAQPSGLSGGGVIWQTLGTRSFDVAGSERSSLFAYFAEGTPDPSSALTLTLGYTAATVHWQWLDIDGPTTAVQATTGVNTGGSSTPAATFASPFIYSGPTLFIEAHTAAATFDASGDGFTNISDVSSLLASAYKDSADTTPTGSLSGSRGWGVIAAELHELDPPSFAELQTCDCPDFIGYLPDTTISAQNQPDMALDLENGWLYAVRGAGADPNELIRIPYPAGILGHANGDSDYWESVPNSLTAVQLTMPMAVNSDGSWLWVMDNSDDLGIFAINTSTGATNQVWEGGGLVSDELSLRYNPVTDTLLRGHPTIDEGPALTSGTIEWNPWDVDSSFGAMITDDGAYWRRSGGLSRSTSSLSHAVIDSGAAISTAGRMWPRPGGRIVYFRSNTTGAPNWIAYPDGTTEEVGQCTFDQLAGLEHATTSHDTRVNLWVKDNGASAPEVYRSQCRRVGWKINRL